MLKILTLLVLTFTLVACNKTATPEESTAIEAVLKRQLKALMAQNSTELRATSAGREQSWLQKSAAAASTYDGYSLSIKDFAITDYSETKATVVITVLMKTSNKLSNDQTFKSTRSLVKKDNQWKVSKYQDEEPVDVLE